MKLLLVAVSWQIASDSDRLETERSSILDKMEVLQITDSSTLKQIAYICTQKQP